MMQNSWRQSANRADQGQTPCQQQDLLPHSPATIPIGSRASGFVQSGFNEVAHRGPHDDLSRATSQNPPDYEVGHGFRFEPGHVFRPEVGQDSDLMSATLLP
jgi:hypothetical protein